MTTPASSLDVRALGAAALIVQNSLAAQGHDASWRASSARPAR